MALFLCLFAFVLCYAMGRWSLVNGLLAALAVGYVFGITRANLPETTSYFIFDSAVLGLYAALLFHPMTRAMKLRVEGLRYWDEILVLWSLIVFFFPFQDLMIRLVGLRTSIFFLPFLLIGARLTSEDRYKLALGLAGLNLVALAFGGAEFLIGVPQFFPRNAVTRLIYLSKDLVGHTAYRIPASFANAHAYAGAMVVTIPLIGGALLQKRKQHWHLYLLIIGLAASLLGVLLSAARLHFIAAAILVVVLTFSIKSRISYAFGWIVIMVAIGLFASGDARLQRITELQNTDVITERIGWSVNMSFFELAWRYPFGNGLGGGGSSIPYFLQDRLQNPLAMENEYARVMLEQGIFGLFLWIAFIVWLLARHRSDPLDSWREGRRLAWWSSIIMFSTGLIGVGLFVSIPHTCLFFINAGWIAARQDVAVSEEEQSGASYVFKRPKQLAT